MRIFLLIILIILSSCNKKTTSVYTEATFILEHTIRLHDSALKQLEMIQSKNDSLLDIYCPKL